MVFKETDFFLVSHQTPVCLEHPHQGFVILKNSSFLNKLCNAITHLINLVDAVLVSLYQEQRVFARVCDHFEERMYDQA